MKWTLLLLLATGCFAAQKGAAPAPVADTPANRLSAAKRYLKVVPPEEIVSGTIDQVAAQLPPDRREEFKRALQKVLNTKKIEELTVNMVTRHFTVKEINALTAFYGSPEGRSISKKFGAYMADIMPALQEELEGALAEIEKEVH